MPKVKKSNLRKVKLQTLLKLRDNTYVGHDGSLFEGYEVEYEIKRKEDRNKWLKERNRGKHYKL